MSVMKQQKFVPIDIDALRRQFDGFDKDGSGYLEAGEAVAALTMIGSKLKFEDLDTDGDNRISFDEVRVAPKRLASPLPRCRLVASGRFFIFYASC